VISAHRGKSGWHEIATVRLEALGDGLKRWTLPVFGVTDFLRVAPSPRLFSRRRSSWVAARAAGRERAGGETKSPDNMVYAIGAVSVTVPRAGPRRCGWQRHCPVSPHVLWEPTSPHRCLRLEEDRWARSVPGT